MPEQESGWVEPFTRTVGLPYSAGANRISAARKIPAMRRSTLLLLALSLACSDSPTAPTGCADFSGTWDVTYQGSCPTNNYPPVWDLQQEGCSVHSRVMPDVPSVTGTAQGSTIGLAMSNGFTTCLYQLAGDGHLDGQTIRATLSGSVSGPCCSTRSSDTVQVVAIRRR